MPLFFHDLTLKIGTTGIKYFIKVERNSLSTIISKIQVFELIDGFD